MASQSDPSNEIPAISKPSATREEGELSSSGDDQEHHNYSYERLSGTTAYTPVPDTAPLVKDGTQAIQAGFDSNQSQITTKRTSAKNIEKNHLLPKSIVPGWSASQASNKNLVICFSDDESGSDHDDHRHDKIFASKGNMKVFVRHQNALFPSLAKSNKFQRNARNSNKVTPKKFSQSRTFVPSMAKVHGSKDVGPSLLGQGSRVRKVSSLNKKFARQEHESNQAVRLNDTKLQDLRQQIALRESELKLKAAHQNKESAPVLSRDPSSSNVMTDTRKCTVTSSDITPSAPKEPDRKRLKVGECYSTEQDFGTQLVVSAKKSNLPSKENMMENCRMHQNEIHLSGAELNTVRGQKQHDKEIAVLSQDISLRVGYGADINTCSNQFDTNSKQDSEELTHLLGSSIYKANSVNNLKSGTSHQEVERGDIRFQESERNMTWNAVANANISEHSNKNLPSLLEMEEMEEFLDKELEEAQEHRRKCEIEERNAMKAYRKAKRVLFEAKRALFEANFRCTNLYHDSEAYSTWLSGQYEHVESGLGYLSDTSKVGCMIPISRHQMHPEYHDINQPGYDSDAKDVDNTCINTSYRHMSGHNAGSKPSSDPDASTSEPLPPLDQNTVSGYCSPSCELDTLANDEQLSPSRHVSTESNMECYRGQKNAEDIPMGRDNRSGKLFDTGSYQDSFLLEATLRSKLFAMLENRDLPKNSNVCCSVGPDSERGAENDISYQKSPINNVGVPFSGPAKGQHSDLKGNEGLERKISAAPVLIHKKQCNNEISLNSFSDAALGSQKHLVRHDHCLTDAVSISPLIFRSAFSHLKVKLPCSPKKLISSNQQNLLKESNDEGTTYFSSFEKKGANMITNSLHATDGNSACGEGTYISSPPVDPNWPLCMYELRGKCNNDECPWQHVRDYHDVMHHHQCDDPNKADPETGSALIGQNNNGGIKMLKCENATSIPTYLVGLDTMKADLKLSRSVLTHIDAQCWQKCFTVSLATSKFLQNGLFLDGKFLDGCDGRIEVHGPWNKQSSYFTRSSSLTPIEKALADKEHALEKVLCILTEECDKLQGVREALFVLSRALETDPTSTTLWIVYLLIYYGNRKSNDVDDLFSLAVKNNEGSYVLWLMYINSRKQLDEQLGAYEAALSALCHDALASERNRMHSSACILDLFVQMMDCLCMSGKVEKANAVVIPDEPHILSLSDILPCLTFSDKCVFWICCVYIVLYKKMPDAVVQRIECEKELLEVGWPCVQLTDEEKQRALKLVDTAVGSLDSFIYNESTISEVDLQSAQLFALNHVWCIAALFGSRERVRNLLDKYLKLYPSCLELVLVSARLQKPDMGNRNFLGFEEALNKWPKEVPGINCVWNQYVEAVLQDGRIDFAKELLGQWFNSVWEVQYPEEDRVMAAMDGIDVNICSSLRSASKSVLGISDVDHDQLDILFGYLNLSIYKILQNEHTAAFATIQKAMKAAISGNMKHHMRKHVMCLLSVASLLEEDDPLLGIRKILEICRESGWLSIVVPCMLSRKFIDDIKKPRVQQLINNMLCPISNDSSLINVILKVRYGPSLLPELLKEPKHLVDFVEAILDFVPSNFQLAMSVCKMLTERYNSDTTSDGLWFWTCSTFVDAILCAIPIPPEYVWVEGGSFLENVKGIEAISKRFYTRALSVYPFSVKLWESFYNLSKSLGDVTCVVEERKERGISI